MTTRTTRSICAAMALVGCTAARRGVVLAPLEDEGEIFVAMRPIAQEMRGLIIVVDSASVIAPDGTLIPLALRHETLTLDGERLLGSARLAPGTYNGLSLKLRKATLVTSAGSTELAVAPEPVRVEAPIALARRRATVIALEVRAGLAFTVSVPARTLPALAGYCSNGTSHDLTVFDKHGRLVSDVLPTGREPWGIALDALSNRAYVALSGEDQVEVRDLQSGEQLARIRLSVGDAPRDLALTPDRRLLLSANSGSNSISFIDPASMSEVGRAAAGEEPTWILMDRRGVRAYVFNTRSNTISVVDLANRSVAATVATEDHPLRGQLDRAGARLYVAQTRSPWMMVFSLPDLSVQKRVYVGLGATGIKVDPATGLIYLARGDENRLAVYDPFSFMPVDTIDLPGAASQMVIDDAQNALFALLPESRSIAIVDLNARRGAATIDVGDSPRAIALSGERQ